MRVICFKRKANSRKLINPCFWGCKGYFFPSCYLEGRGEGHPFAGMRIVIVLASGGRKAELNLVRFQGIELGSLPTKVDIITAKQPKPKPRFQGREVIT